MYTFWQDIRYGFRMLVKTPGFTIVAVLTLAFGIGINTTIFSSLNAFLIRPLPFDGHERLVWLQEKHETFGDMSVSYPNYLDWKTQNKTFDEIACYRGATSNMTGVERPERLSVRQVTANLFPMLGAQPMLGRSFQESDDKPEAARTAMLSYGFWQQRFGGETDAIGKTIILDQEPFTVIGVMPKHFSFPPYFSSQCDVWAPVGLMEKQEWFMNRKNHMGLSAVGKLKPDFTLAQARNEIDAIASQLKETYPDSNQGNSVVLSTYQDRLTRDIKPRLMLLMGAVTFILLIAVTNIGNLILVRSSARVHEFSIRSAMGAGRGRLIRQVLCENFILVLFGGLAGLLFARWGLNAIFQMLPESPALDPKEFFRIDRTVLSFLVAVTLISGFLLSLIPAWQSSKVNLNDTIKDSGHSTTGGTKRNRFRDALVVTEISLALIVLVGAGLMIRSFYEYLQADPGYNPRNAVTMNLSLIEQKYPEDAQVNAFYRDLLQRVNAIPGVQHAGVASNMLGEWQSSYYVDGAPVPKPGQNPFAEYNCVSPDYFQALGVRLIEGRYFNQTDVQGSKPVVIVDELFAQKWWPGESAIGKRLQEHTEKPNGNKPWREVIGVVAHVKHYGVDQFSRESLFFSMEQMPDRIMTLVVRTQGDPMRFVEPIRREILALDNELPFSNIQTLADIAEERAFMRRYVTTLLVFFALTALFLAALGIYGVMAYSVSQRTREFGIRMAMGATVRDVLFLVLRKGVWLAAIGAVIGLAGSLAVSRALSGMLFQVDAIDPMTYLAVSVFLLIIAMLACLLPARRAAKVDPIVALRYE